MVPEINWLAVVLATVSSMVVGFIWYAKPVFGKLWIRLSGVDESTMGNGVAAIIVTVIVSFVTAAVLAGSAAIAQSFYGGNFLLNTVITSVILWAGFTAARFVTHDAFDRRPAQLTVLNCAHELVTVVIMALIIGAFGISAA
jgi:hypothetical protein